MIKKISYQAIPIAATIITFLLLVVGIRGVIALLNFLPLHGKIISILAWPDVLVGLTIYIKTSIDFALFIGTLMSRYTGMRNRLAIELGTSLGNGIGTALVLCIWTFFKEIPLLLIAMIFLAAIVLLRMAEESLVEFLSRYTPPLFIKKCIVLLVFILEKISFATKPITRFILPSSPLASATIKTFAGLVFFSFTIPFILGLDDFAGYIPLFSIVNVFGFATGAFLGHMLLNAALFAAPSVTVKIVRHPIVIVLGSVAFIVIAGIGVVEAAHIASHYFLPR